MKIVHLFNISQPCLISFIIYRLFDRCWCVFRKLCANFWKMPSNHVYSSNIEDAYDRAKRLIRDRHTAACSKPSDDPNHHDDGEEMRRWSDMMDEREVLWNSYEESKRDAKAKDHFFKKLGELLRKYREYWRSSSSNVSTMNISDSYCFSKSWILIAAPFLSCLPIHTRRDLWRTDGLSSNRKGSRVQKWRWKIPSTATPWAGFS